MTENLEYFTLGKPIVLVDLDGVVINSNHRLHHIVEVVDGVERHKENADYAAFTRESHLDSIGVCSLPVRHMIESQAFDVRFLTARVCHSEDELHKLTIQLQKFVHSGVRSRSIYMRPLNPNLSEPYPDAAGFKGRVVETLRAQGHLIAMAIDDSHQNCKMFMQLGVPTFRFYNHLNPTKWNY